MPSAARRASSAGVDGGTSTSTNAPSRQSTASSRRPPGRPIDPMDRQGVEQLVGQDGPGLRGGPTAGRARAQTRSRPRSGARRARPAVPGRARSGHTGSRWQGQATRRRVRGRPGRPAPRGSARARAPEPAPYSRTTNRSGAPSRRCDLGELPGDRGTEDRVGLGGGQEVALIASSAPSSSGSSQGPARTAPWP